MNKLYGAILGDLAGQPYEFNCDRYPEKCNIHDNHSKITDDTIMTLASASSIINHTDVEHEYKYWGRKYNNVGFGKGFRQWLETSPGTEGHSWGNGCIMRVSPYYWLNPVMGEGANESIITSHKDDSSIEAEKILQDLYFRGVLDTPEYPKMWEKFVVKALPTVHFVKSVFYHTSSTKEAIQLAVSLGGDTDTTASIVGELSNYHRNDLTKEDIEFVESKLDDFQLKILKQFNLC